MRALGIVSMMFVAALAVGCKKGDDGGGGGGGSAETAAKPVTPTAPAKLVPVDISVGGEAFQGLTVQAPEGATAKESFGAVEVHAGDGFALEIHVDASDLAGRKKEIEANDINKLKRWVTDTADEQVYESEVMGKSQYHFNANVKVGDRAFNCENVKGGADKTLEQTQAMLASCKSIAAGGGGGAAPAGGSAAAPAGSAAEPAEPTTK